MRVKASNVARILADIDLTMDDVAEIALLPGKIRVVVREDGHDLVREYGVDLDA
jgi:hypothetical protein